eukprot:TRINITY_DN394_c0_g1_i1.p1 TRINITY_DN394_c0_g1~~TRINITY_DN394_c0_g1_i1.p1  ORF type:complete len:305 (+),score=47.57 TRINITY_DN394_c0_g1_i1:655-1569(+)
MLLTKDFLHNLLLVVTQPFEKGELLYHCIFVLKQLLPPVLTSEYGEKVGDLVDEEKNNHNLPLIPIMVSVARTSRVIRQPNGTCFFVHIEAMRLLAALCKYETWRPELLRSGTCRVLCDLSSCSNNDQLHLEVASGLASLLDLDLPKTDEAQKDLTTLQIACKASGDHLISHLVTAVLTVLAPILKTLAQSSTTSETSSTTSTSTSSAPSSQQVSSTLPIPVYKDIIKHCLRVIIHLHSNIPHFQSIEKELKENNVAVFLQGCQRLEWLSEQEVEAVRQVEELLEGQPTETQPDESSQSWCSIM